MRNTRNVTQTHTAKEKSGREMKWNEMPANNRVTNVMGRAVHTTVRIKWTSWKSKLIWRIHSLLHAIYAEKKKGIRLFSLHSFSNLWCIYVCAYTFIIWVIHSLLGRGSFFSHSTFYLSSPFLWHFVPSQKAKRQLLYDVACNSYARLHRV